MESMKTSQTLGLLLTLALLTSCGGGGSPYVATTDAECTLALKYASGTSGIAIAEGSDWTLLNTELSRPLSACKIERLQAANLGLCIRDDNPADLMVKVHGPQNSVTPGLALAGIPGVSENGCKAMDDRAQQFNLSLNISPFTSLATLDGSWLVQVRDTRAGFGSGTLIGWTLTFQGLRW